jgi:hypothetical protein
MFERMTSFNKHPLIKHMPDIPLVSAAPAVVLGSASLVVAEDGNNDNPV